MEILNDPDLNPTITLSKNGVENCKTWAKERNMNITFVVSL